MKCPGCEQPAITFAEWSRGINAFRTSCRSCGRPLKGNTATWSGLLATLIIFALWLPLSGPVLDALGLDPGDYATRALVVMPVALVGGLIAWLVGGYDLADPPPFRPAVNGPRFEANRSDPATWAFLFASIVFFFLAPAAIVVTGYEDLLLIPFGEETVARVVSAEQGRPFFSRQGDWWITYELDAGGRDWRGRDVLPPALMRPGLETIRVRYVRGFPSISRIDSQVSLTPVVALLVLSITVTVYLRTP